MGWGRLRFGTRHLPQEQRLGSSGQSSAAALRLQELFPCRRRGRQRELQVSCTSPHLTPKPDGHSLIAGYSSSKEFQDLHTHARTHTHAVALKYLMRFWQSCFAPSGWRQEAADPGESVGAPCRPPHN